MLALQDAAVSSINLTLVKCQQEPTSHLPADPGTNYLTPHPPPIQPHSKLLVPHPRLDNRELTVSLGRVLSQDCLNQL